MNDAKHPVLSHKGRTEAEERQRRQAEALRANLARRKAQGRARAEGGAEGAEGAACRPAGAGVQDSES